MEFILSSNLVGYGGNTVMDDMSRVPTRAMGFCLQLPTDEGGIQANKTKLEIDP